MRHSFTFVNAYLLHQKDTAMCRAVTVELNVAITPWCLAHLFGIARSTVCEIIHETCDVLVSTLLRTYITFHSGQKLDSVVEGFSIKWGVPQCVGAINGCHVPIAAPHSDYYNRKGFFFVLFIL